MSYQVLGTLPRFAGIVFWGGMESGMDNLAIVVILMTAGLISVFLLGWFVGRQLERGRNLKAKRDADRIVADAQKEAETMFREKLLELKDEQIRLKSQQESEYRSKLNEIARSERSFHDREANLKNRSETVEKRSKEQDKLEQQLTQREKTVKEKEAVIDSLMDEHKAALERVGHMTQE